MHNYCGRKIPPVTGFPVFSIPIEDNATYNLKTHNEIVSLENSKIEVASTLNHHVYHEMIKYVRRIENTQSVQFSQLVMYNSL